MKKSTLICFAALLLAGCLLLTGFVGGGNRDKLNGVWNPTEGHGSLAFSPDGAVLGYSSSGVALWKLTSCDEKQLVMEQSFDYGSYAGRYEYTFSYVLSEDGKELTLTDCEIVTYDAEGKEQERQQSSGESVYQRIEGIFGTWESEENQVTIELKEDGTASSTVAGEKGPEQLLMVDPAIFNIITLNKETGLIETVEQFDYTLSEDGKIMTVTYETMYFYDEEGNVYDQEFYPIEMVLNRK